MLKRLRLKRAAVLLVFSVGLCSTGCQRPQAVPPAPPPPTVTVTRPIPYPVQTYFEYNGNLEAVEMVQVTARVKGFLNEIPFTEGIEVKKGDLLFKIDPREYAAAVKRAEADKMKATAELKRAKAEENRVRQLRTTRAASDEELEQRVAARETAEAIVLQTEAAIEVSQLQMAYTEIRSPIAGLISRTHVTRGNLVGQNENAVLTTIVSMDPLYVYFDVPERDLIEYQRTLRSDQQAELLNRTLKLEIGVATETGYPHVGAIDFRENRVDPGTGTVRIRGRIPNPRVPPGNARLLYPGLYARVRVPSGSPRMVPALPEDALMTGQEGQYVYVVDDKDIVQKRTVTVGPAVWKSLPPDQVQTVGWMLAAGGVQSPANAEPISSVVAIERGLAAGDRVVINGLTKARPGSPVTAEMRELKPPPAAAAKK